MSAQRLAIVDAALEQIDKTYVDRSRLKPQRMLTAALEGMQRDIAEVITSQPDADHIVVQANAAVQSFAVADVVTIPALELRLAEVFRFARAHLAASSDIAKLEYAAVNGMLGSLDPHSVLLDPDEARDMASNVEGKFGGIGVVIGPDPHGVVITKLLEGDTPARRDGLMAGDRIASIDGDSTENLELFEAMAKLRGAPDTKVELAVDRQGTTTVHTLVRAEVIVHGVEHELLADHVGYVLVFQFSHGVAADVAAAIADLRKRGARSWILDLRDNPGGLLNEAIALVDEFVSSGTITTTIGNGVREEHAATESPDDEHGPLVVLVNGGSASAAEVAAGALAQLDRAVILGRLTFGKGSVQVLYDNPDGSKLKLTVAQYLVGNDVSLQGTGIAPNVELDPVVVPPKLGDHTAVHLIAPTTPHEADFDTKLTSDHAIVDTRARPTITYLADPPPAGDAFHEDTEIRIARELVGSPRAELLDGSAKPLAAARSREQARIVSALHTFGVDWAAGGTETPLLTATFTVTPAAAGEIVAITGSVTNSGRVAASRVRARATSDDPTFDGTELAFGAIAVGATRTATAYIKVPAAAVARTEVLNWELADGASARFELAMPAFHVESVPHPQFAFTYELTQDSELRVHVSNIGRGRSRATTVVAASKDASIKARKVELGALEPGKGADVTFAIKPKTPQFSIELGVADSELLDETNEKLQFPNAKAGAVSPPILELEAGTLETAADHWTLSGRARDDRQVRDGYVLVSNRGAKIEDKKVLYLSNAANRDPTTLTLTGSVPLWRGANKITIVVREDDSIRTTRTVWVHRD